MTRDRLEYEAHALAGERLARSVAGVSEAAEVVAAHEECFDGSGYPAGLGGGDIPLEARIVACAVALAKLQPAIGAEAAAGELERQSGGALDPEVVSAALALIAREHGDPSRHLRDVPAA